MISKCFEDASSAVCLCIQLQGHLDSAQCQQQTEQDLNTTIQKKCAQLEEEGQQR